VRYCGHVRIKLVLDVLRWENKIEPAHLSLPLASTNYHTVNF